MVNSFRLEIDVGGTALVQIDLSDEAIGKDRHPVIRALATKGDRESYRAAAVELARRIIDPDRPGPVEIIEDTSMILIPRTSVRSVRVRDLSLESEPRRPGIGFGSADASPVR